MRTTKQNLSLIGLGLPFPQSLCFVPKYTKDFINSKEKVKMTLDDYNRNSWQKVNSTLEPNMDEFLPATDGILLILF